MKKINQEGERTIKVSEDVQNQLHSAHYFSKKKGKTLFIFIVSKEQEIIDKKERNILSYDQLRSKKEIKEYLPKRAKLDKEYKMMNRLIQKLSKKEKRDKEEMKEVR